jgi:hypothetical protein
MSEPHPARIQNCAKHADEQRLAETALGTTYSGSQRP